MGFPGGIEVSWKPKKEVRMFEEYDRWLEEVTEAKIERNPDGTYAVFVPKDELDEVRRKLKKNLPLTDREVEIARIFEL